MIFKQIIICFLVFTIQVSLYAQVQQSNPLPDYFKPGSNHPLGARPDCSETKVPITKLEEIANNANVNNIVDFVGQLPSGSFQTFTLVTNSMSLQKGSGESKVSDQWPRVLRTSTDGKITFSYTCNPQSETYNQVEVIYYDDNGRQLKTMSLDFNKPTQNRVVHNDQRCLSCHATTMADGSKSLKHIWGEYFQWGGCDDEKQTSVYGSNDDQMDPSFLRYGGFDKNKYPNCNHTMLREKHVKEIENFKRFKEKNLGSGENNNPCYSSLPWAKPTGKSGTEYDPAKYNNYPYGDAKSSDVSTAGKTGFMNYYTRPNLKLTETYSRINAKRIAGLIERSPNFERIKYFLALEAAECSLSSEEIEEVNKLIPNLKYIDEGQYTKGTNAQTPKQSSPLLYSYAKSIGIMDENWTLEYNSQDPNYHASIPTKLIRGETNEGNQVTETGIPAVVGGEIVSIISKTDNRIKENSKNSYTKGVSEAFGPQWSCIDDIAGAISEDAKKSYRPLCKSIRASLQEYLVTAKSACDPVNPDPKIDDLDKNASGINQKISENDPLKKGKEIVDAKCMDCHTGPLPPPLHTFDQGKIKSALESGKMPKGSNKLEASEILNVLEYVKTFNSNN